MNGVAPSGERFRDMLTAVSFKRELIIVIFQLEAGNPFVWLDQVMTRLARYYGEAWST
jgi:hypothetical protein